MNLLYQLSYSTFYDENGISTYIYPAGLDIYSICLKTILKKISATHVIKLGFAPKTSTGAIQVLKMVRCVAYATSNGC